MGGIFKDPVEEARKQKEREDAARATQQNLEIVAKNTNDFAQQQLAAQNAALTAAAKAQQAALAARHVDTSSTIRKNLGGFFGSALGGYSSGSYFGSDGSARGRLLGG